MPRKEQNAFLINSVKKKNDANVISQVGNVHLQRPVDKITLPVQLCLNYKFPNDSLIQKGEQSWYMVNALLKKRRRLSPNLKKTQTMRQSLE